MAIIGTDSEQKAALEADHPYSLYWSITANGNSSSKLIRSAFPLQFIAHGTFGGGTVQLQTSPDNGTTWIDVSGAALSANGYVGVIRANPNGELFRIVTSGATTPEITCKLEPVND